MKNKDSIFISLDKDVKEKLENYSKESLIPKSALINKLIKNFLEDIENIKNSKTKK